MTVWPTGNKSKPYTSDGFGWREAHPITGVRTFHYGWDSYGYTYNCAPEAGVVIFAQYNGTAGNHIQIRTPAGVVYGTMHNSKILVSVNEEVAEGQALGVQGTTGGSTGVHNHQEVLVNAQYTDPEVYIGDRVSGKAGLNATPFELEEQDDDMRLIHQVFTNGNQAYVVSYPFSDEIVNKDDWAAIQKTTGLVPKQVNEYDWEAYSRNKAIAEKRQLEAIAKHLK